MKRIICALLLATSLTFAYCEHGTKINESWEGGHKSVLYDFGQGRILQFNFPSGATIPWSIRYDFWKGEVCYN